MIRENDEIEYKVVLVEKCVGMLVDDDDDMHIVLIIMLEHIIELDYDDVDDDEIDERVMNGMLMQHTIDDDEVVFHACANILVDDEADTNE